MIRRSTGANTARSTGNSKPRPEILDDGAAAGLLPQPPEQERRADALAGEPVGVAGVDLGEDERPLGVAGHGGGQALEGAGGGDGLLAAEVLDDALPGAAALAHRLDEVEPPPRQPSYGAGFRGADDVGPAPPSVGGPVPPHHRRRSRLRM